MKLNNGDFIISNYSNFPSLIIYKKKDRYLISINEYGGDYIWIKEEEVKKIKLEPCEELSIISKFEEWFYKAHTNIYQEIIIKNLNNYFL
tara:strand:- start:191 stop:460 length:270 start_codon:yes stop_codon:yes gene_type:complete